LEKQKLIAAFQLLYLGSPMIYYGDESGMWGSNDPDCRKPMVWANQKYNAETFNPNQSKHEADNVEFNADLFNWYKKFIGLRNQYKAIQLGSYSTIEINDAEKTYAFSRKLGSEEVIVIINRSDKAVLFEKTILKKGNYKEVFTKKVMKKVIVKPMDVVVLSNTIH
jgi:glycosidase